MKRRVVIDTSSLVSAAIRPGSIPDQSLTHALATAQLCTSVEHLSELEAVLRRPRFDVYVSLESRLTLLASIGTHALSVTIPQTCMDQARGNCRDENDSYLLALAMASGATILISSDNDLLALHPWRGVRILTPAQFLTLPIQPQFH